MCHLQFYGSPVLPVPSSRGSQEMSRSILREAESIIHQLEQKAIRRVGLDKARLGE